MSAAKPDHLSYAVAAHVRHATPGLRWNWRSQQVDAVLTWLLVTAALSILRPWLYKRLRGG